MEELNNIVEEAKEKIVETIPFKELVAAGTIGGLISSATTGITSFIMGKVKKKLLSIAANQIPVDQTTTTSDQTMVTPVQQPDEKANTP